MVARDQMPPGLRIRICLSRIVPGEGGLGRYSHRMLIRYARVSTSGQDLADNVTVLQRSVFMINTSVLTTACRERHEPGPASARPSLRAVRATFPS